MPLARRTRRSLLLTAGAVVALAAALPVSQALSGHGAEGWKGAESLTPLTIAPDPGRCGSAPVNLHARFAGTGIDTNGGTYTVSASGCLNTQTRRLSHLRATDTYTRNGDSVNIDIEDFTLRVDRATCVATNKQPARFKVAGGTGSLAGASGHGRFDFAMDAGPRPARTTRALALGAGRHGPGGPSGLQNRQGRGNSTLGRFDSFAAPLARLVELSAGSDDAGGGGR